MADPAYDWQRLKDVFAGARVVPAERRPAYLAEACDGDEALREEVESLLASNERARSFLETPATVQVDDAVDAKRLEGQRIGAYQIDAWIGAGGMGEVYRARDTRLNRLVAIKFCCPASRAIPIASRASVVKRRCSPRSIIRISHRSTASKTPAACEPWSWN